MAFLDTHEITREILRRAAARVLSDLKSIQRRLEEASKPTANVVLFSSIHSMSESWYLQPVSLSLLYQLRKRTMWANVSNSVSWLQYPILCSLLHILLTRAHSFSWTRPAPIGTACWAVSRPVKLKWRKESHDDSLRKEHHNVRLCFSRPFVSLFPRCHVKCLAIF